MTRHDIGKYFFIMLLSAMLAGPAHAQNNTREKKKEKSELPKSDSTAKQTMTHAMPGSMVQTPPRPKRDLFLVGYVDDSYQLDVGAFINMTQNGMRAVFAPTVVAKPFVRFFDRYTIGVHANAMIQNYMDTCFVPVVNKMYLTMAARTDVGTFDISVGKMPAIEYGSRFTESVPFGNYLMHIMYMDSQRFLPRAIIATYRANETMIGAGYGENTNGFGFNGDGYAIITLRQNVGDDFQIGGFVLSNRTRFDSDVYAIYSPTMRDAIVLQLLNLGARPAFYGAYSHTLKNGAAAFSINGFYQSDDGMAGADITFQHIKSGTYISTGARYRNPLINNNAKWAPFVQAGINKTILPRSKTR